MSIAGLDTMVSSPEDLNLIYQLEEEVLRQGHMLIDKITEISNSRGINLQVATSESLTAGLIMSSLVHLPIGGWAKYGCFGVYDTDAKRVFNSVSVDDVYTHTCAKEMAVGLLKNSNATIGISVTGNAMPYKSDLEKLGEVFIGVAGYTQDQSGEVKIIYETRSINQCLQLSELGKQIKKKCDKWAEPNINGKYAPRTLTASVSRLIRNYTAFSAIDFAVEFLHTNKERLIVPPFINESKMRNKGKNGKKHQEIPQSKYPDRDHIALICTNRSGNECDNHMLKYGERWGPNEFVLGDVKGESKDPSKNLLGMRSVSDKAGDVLSSPSLIRSVTAGGMRRRKKRKTRRKKRRSKKKRYTRKR